MHDFSRRSYGRAWPAGVSAALLFIAAGSGVLTARAESTPAVPPPQSAPDVPVVVADVARRDMPVYVVGLGTVQGSSTVTIRSRVDGELKQVFFAEGQDVHAGDVLAQVDPSALQAQLAQSQAQKARDEALLENAKLDLERQEGLAKTGNTTKQALDTQRAQVAQYEAAIRNDTAQITYATVQLGYTEIRSPISGRAGLRLVDAGNLVHAADQGGIVTITTMEPAAVIFTVPEDVLDQVRAAFARGKPEVWAYGRGDKEPRARGTLELIDNQIDSATGTVKLKALFSNADHALWPGQFVTARLFVDIVRDAAVVPDTVVQRGPEGPYAYVVNADRTVAMRPVVVSQAREGLALIAQGLSPGEHVVVDGQYKLKPGSRISEDSKSVAVPADPTGPKS